MIIKRLIGRLKSNFSFKLNVPKRSNSAEKFRPSRRTWQVLVLLMLLSLLAAIDATSVSSALAVMTSDLKGTTMQAVWVGTAYSFTSAVVQPIYASMSDIFGRQVAVMVSLVFFAVGAIISGVAHNMHMMIAGRAVQGVGGGGVLVLTEIIIADLIPLRERGKYYGFLGAMWALGTAIGPLMGGAFAVAGGSVWRWVYYVNLPFCGVGLVLTPLVLKLKLEKSTLRQKFARIDYIGMALLTASSTSFLIGITFGGVMHPWKSANVLVPLILGAVGMIGTGIYEHYVPEKPMFPVAVFANRSAIISYVQVFVHGLILWCVIYFLPLFYQGVKEYSPIISSVAMLPEVVAISPSAILTGLFIALTGWYLHISRLAWALMLSGSRLIAIVNRKTSVGAFVGLNIPFSIGSGILFSSLNIAILAANKPERSASAASVIAFVRVLGQSVGIAVGGAIFSNRMTIEVAQFPDLAAFSDSANAIAAIETIKHMSESRVKDELIYAFEQAIHFIFYILMGLSGIGILSNFFAKQYPIDVELIPDQGILEGEYKSEA